MLPNPSVLFVPLVLIPLCFLTIGIGFILALANGVFRDIANSLTMILTFAMFLTPVVYPPPTQGLKVLINYINTVSPFIIAVRDLTIDGKLSQPGVLFATSVFSIIFFFFCWRLFHLAMWRIVERV
jgi:lipopolysaccharide transport system permease protein